MLGHRNCFEDHQRTANEFNRRTSRFLDKVWRLEVGPDYKRPELAAVKEFRSELAPILFT
jgi:hypothetical protein